MAAVYEAEDDYLERVHAALFGRKRIPEPNKETFTLADLEQQIELYDAEIDKLSDPDGEATSGLLDEAQMKKLQTQWRAAFDRLRKLAADENLVLTRKDAQDARTELQLAFRKLLIVLRDARHALNNSLEAFDKQYADMVEIAKQQEESQRLIDELKAKGKSSKKESSAEPPADEVRVRPPTAKPGLGAKWGKYNKDLKHKGQLQFRQHVPEGAATIQRALKSQNILDAVHNRGKAFWLADPAQYQISSAQGKCLMVYTFTAKGARSLMEDYLICGSGDFAGDNDEPWAGETAHPNYTIWKTNELGAYGVGSARLAELRGEVAKIEAFGPDDKPIAPD
jgi:hypothetical protein